MPKKPVVHALIFEQFHLFELGIVSEIFGLPRPEIENWPEVENWYEFRVVSAAPDKVSGYGGIHIEASSDLSGLVDSSLILVPGWSSVETEPPGHVKEALQAAHEAGARIASVCSGAFLLAACGFLDGKSATTHWRYADELQQRYPQIDVNPDVLYVDAGSIMTSAGSAAGIDLCLHIVRQDFGSDIANMVAKRLVVPAYREGGQAQFISRPVPKDRGGHIAPLLDAIRQDLNAEWPVTKMAQQIGVTERTLLRRFKEAVGLSPQAWLVTERVSRVKDLLETTELSIAELAETSGFVTPETLRHHFRRHVGLSPTLYKERFGGSVGLV